MTTPTNLQDIAAAAGVHPASVSRALRGIPGKVSEETRQRILRIAQEMGYRPNAVAASLRTKRTNLVALVVPDVGNPVFGPLVQGLETGLREHGLLCLVVHQPAGASQRRELVRELADRRVAGLVILAAERHDAMLEEVALLKLPAVLLNRGTQERRFSSVVNDDRESVRLVLQHLRELGHSRIAHLAGPGASSTGTARREAFTSLSAELGLKNCTVVESEAFTVEAGAAAAAELWSRRARPTAIFAANDLIALGALQVLRDRGVAVPADVSLVGHNDMPLLEFIAPPLTTVRIATAQMSRAAALLLLEAMTQPDHLPTLQVLPPQLVVRGSTAAVRSSRA